MSTGERLRVAVVGPGRAGGARIRALEDHARAELRAVVGRTPRPGEPSLEDVLGAETIDAVILCTPNLLHAPAVRAALEAGKHVCVEFPLAPDPATARGLFALAERAGRVLHVEHIELLSSAQRWLRERARELGPVLEGELEFTGDLGGWLAEPALSGSAALGALARLHRLLDLFGGARVERARLVPLAPGHRLEVELRFASGGSVWLLESRAPGLRRATRWDLRCVRGALGTPPDQPAGRLFREDLDHFLARVLEGEPSYVAPSRVLEGLELVEAIERSLPG